MPLYSPFMESNIARLMIETSNKLRDDHIAQRAIISKLNKQASQVMTTHGYSADINAKRSTLSQFKKMATNLTRQLIYDLNPLLKHFHFSASKVRKIKHQVKIAEDQRSFWQEALQEKLIDDLAIYEIVDKEKLEISLLNNSYPSMLQARLAYLNRLVEEIDPRIE
jgi:hypothetical protein